MMADEPTEVTFQFTKGEGHRTVFADGVWGGVTPAGTVRMGFYTQYEANPESVTYRAIDGKLAETARTGQEYLVREVSVDVLLTLASAASLRDWLTRKIEEAESVRADASATVVIEG